MWSVFRRNARQTKSARRTPPSVRPRLEALEDRCLLNAGFLDPTFGTAGAGMTSPGAAVLIQSDGKLVEDQGGSLVRYNTDGSLDTSFGSGGAQPVIGATAMTFQSDGKILLVGSNELERLNSNGTPDTSFGNQGVVSTPITENQRPETWQIVEQTDGKIVVAGCTWSGGAKGLSTTFDLVRYNTDGSLDTTFGKGGTVVTSLSQDSEVNVRALLLQPNSDLIVVGDTGISQSYDWLLARYNPDGSLDTSFGNQGISTIPLGPTPPPGDGGVSGALLYPSTGTSNDGKIAVTGYNNLTASWDLARFNADGSLDTTFGSGGFAPLLVTSPSGPTFDSSGRFVVAGTSSGEAVERLNSDGTPDTTFGSGGVATVGITGSSGSRLAIYPGSGTDTADAGKIVVSGSYVARFLPSAPQSGPSFVVTAPSSVTTGTPFSVTVTAVNADGSTDTNYTGTVDFSSFAAQADLPANYTFTAADQGAHTFTVTFDSTGPQSLFVADAHDPSMNGRQLNIQVNPVNPGPVT